VLYLAEDLPMMLSRDLDSQSQISATGGRILRPLVLETIREYVKGKKSPAIGAGMSIL
jgi:hypothetical protein